MTNRRAGEWLNVNYGDLDFQLQMPKAIDQDCPYCVLIIAASGETFGKPVPHGKMAKGERSAVCQTHFDNVTEAIEHAKQSPHRENDDALVAVDKQVVK